MQFVHSLRQVVLRSYRRFRGAFEPVHVGFATFAEWTGFCRQISRVDNASVRACPRHVTACLPAGRPQVWHCLHLGVVTRQSAGLSLDHSSVVPLSRYVRVRHHHVRRIYRDIELITCSNHGEAVGNTSVLLWFCYIANIS